MLKKVFILCCVTAFALAMSSCTTPDDLDPNGPYQKDAYLYNIDASIIASYNIVDAFLIFELQNNAFIKTNAPVVFELANTIREKTPSTLKNINQARNLYIKYLGSTAVADYQARLVASNALQNSVNELKSTANTATIAVTTIDIGNQFTNTLNEVNQANTNISDVLPQ
jgi:hypothetical protein